MEENLKRIDPDTIRSVLDHFKKALDSLNSSNTLAPAGAGQFEPPLCEALMTKIESQDFVEKLGSIHMSLSRNCSDDSSSWDMISAKDLWEAENDSDHDGYVHVSQEDLVDGLTCFIAAYLLSLEETKDLTPNQLQAALNKTFSVKSKSNLRKAWDGSIVIYNVASWCATAFGMYKNPAVLKAATVTVWSSCRALSKLL